MRRPSSLPNNQQTSVLAEAMHMIKSPLYIADVWSTVVWANAAFFRLTGFEEQEIIGQSLRRLGFRPLIDDVCASDNNLATNEEQPPRAQDGEHLGRRKNGTIIIVEQTVSHIRLSETDDDYFVCLLEDVTARRHVQRDLDHALRHDLLTDLPNRSFFLEEVAAGLKRIAVTGRMVALIILDLDHFKDINNTHGQTIGNLALTAIAGRLQRLVRSGVTAARLGGDEFAVLFEDIDDDRSVRLAVNLVGAAFGAPVSSDGGANAITLTASVGVAAAGVDANRPTAEIFLDQAELAMFHAKSEGGNCTRFFHAQMTEEAQRRAKIINGLRRALERAEASSELSVAFQPQVDLTNGRLVRAEALCRWRNPTLGTVSPAEFIAAAEESGLIHALGAHVLEMVCRHLRMWLDQGRAAVPVAVNLSPLQMAMEGWDAAILERLDHYRLNPSLLTLEITETVLLRRSPIVADSLRRLVNCGMRVEIDDFGVGYSSLSYLQDLPIAGLKIDRSFVLNMQSHAGNRAIVAAVSGLAHNLGLEVVAEGVETAAHVAALQTFGALTAQGYYFARPMDADAFASLLSFPTPILPLPASE